MIDCSSSVTPPSNLHNLINNSANTDMNGKYDGFIMEGKIQSALTTLASRELLRANVYGLFAL